MSASHDHRKRVLVRVVCGFKFGVEWAPKPGLGTATICSVNGAGHSWSGAESCLPALPTKPCQGDRVWQGGRCFIPLRATIGG